MLWVASDNQGCNQMCTIGLTSGPWRPCQGHKSQSFCPRDGCAGSGPMAQRMYHWLLHQGNGGHSPIGPSRQQVVPADTVEKSCGLKEATPFLEFTESWYSYRCYLCVDHNILSAPLNT